MAVDMQRLLGDLGEESRVLEAILSSLHPSEWERPTPAEGWAVRDQVSHLAYFDDMAVIALTDPDRFKSDAESLLLLGNSFPDVVARRYASEAPEQLFDWFRSSRRKLIEAFSQVEGRVRVPWYGPEMSAASSITARLMETWAHGQDIADTFGVERELAARLRHIAHLGFTTFAFSYRLRGLEVPQAEVRVELRAPDDSQWVWGPDGTSERVSGSALDFCLVVTQRRHLADTDLVVEGAIASEWMGIAQAFAGAPSSGRKPGSPSREVGRGDGE